MIYPFKCTFENCKSLAFKKNFRDKLSRIGILGRDASFHRFALIFQKLGKDID